MSWTAIVLIVVQFLGPLLLKWLEDLLKEAASSLDRGKHKPGEMSPAIADLTLWIRAQELLEARGKAISWWNFWGQAVHQQRTRQFNRAMAAAGRRYGQFTRAALYGEPVSPLVWSEEEEIKNPPEW